MHTSRFTSMKMPIASIPHPGERCPRIGWFHFLRQSWSAPGHGAVSSTRSIIVKTGTRRPLICGSLGTSCTTRVFCCDIHIYYTPSGLEIATTHRARIQPARFIEYQIYSRCSSLCCREDGLSIEAVVWEYISHTAVFLSLLKSVYSFHWLILAASHTAVFLSYYHERVSFRASLLPIYDAWFYIINFSMLIIQVFQ